VPAQSQDSPSSTPRLMLKDGTPVELKFVRMVASSQVIAGEKVDLRVTREVRVGDVIVVGKDSIAEATVTVAQARRRMARGGCLELKIDTVRLANGEAAPLRLVEDVKGGGHKGQMIAGMIAVGVVDAGFAPLFLNLEGKDATIPADTEITAYVDGDVPFEPAESRSVATVNQQEARDTKETMKQLEDLACGPSEVEHSVRTVMDPQPLPVQPADRALIYVIRPTHIGMLVQTKLSVDRKWVGVNRVNNYFYLTLEPGPHYFCTQEGDYRSLLSMVVEQGKTYYLQQRIVSTADLQLLDEQEGKEGLAKCKLSVFKEKK